MFKYQRDFLKNMVDFRDMEKLGFTVNEAKVYLTSIRLGPCFAGKIAKEASLDRSSTYNALKQLIERGIVSTVYENKRTIYIPADPKKIVDYFKEKEELANKIIPSLREQYTTAEKKNVLLFQGYKGLKTVFQDILDSADGECSVLGSEGQFREKMPYYEPMFGKRREEKKIRTKMLIREGRTDLSRTKYTQYKKMPCQVVSPVTITIYNGKIAVLIWDEKPEAIIIENKKVSETLKSYFDFMWKYAQNV